MTIYLETKNRQVRRAIIKEAIFEALISRAPLCAAVVTVAVWALIIMGLVWGCSQ